MSEFELDFDLIVDGLEPLIDSGRLTGKLFVDGVLVLDTEAGSVVDPLPALNEYDHYGFSIEQSAYGFVRIKVVDEHIADFLANGDEFQIEIAKRQHQWFGLMVRGRDYTAEETKQMALNSNRMFFIHRDTNFQIYGMRWLNKVFGNTQDTVSRADRKSGEWIRNPNHKGDIVPNHLSPGRYGNMTFPKHPSWEEYMVEKWPAVLVARMDRLAAKAKETHEWNLAHPNAVRPVFLKRP